MDVVLIFNGLGNQMSQYAFYLRKKNINESTYFIPFCRDHNGLELDRVFRVNCKEALIQEMLYILFRILLTDKVKIISTPIKRLLNLLNCKIVKENFNYNFNKDFMIPSKGITFYYGGWHAEKYFLESKKGVIKAFQFSEPDDQENIGYINKINETNSVSIHVRRGDFLNEENVNLFGDVCTKAYFEKAIKLIESKVNKPHFFVFSNDLTWVKENLIISNVAYVACNSGKDSWKDMYLMSLCKHNVISNSTFSWWGAWLNKAANKIVISPSRFLKNDSFTDVYPNSWIKISEY
ncbi:alpha-1,2-fucosyltransferase [Flavobacterium sp. ZS1P14]|uniref:alpha-1,2-fucosyltransferase n=1 Tax=Flavobacterium sp. ZS1P14 TaxID=3401729 RepID=UPI003AAD866E